MLNTDYSQDQESDADDQAVDSSRVTEMEYGVTVPQPVPVPEGVRYDSSVSDPAKGSAGGGERAGWGLSAGAIREQLAAEEASGDQRPEPVSSSQ